MYLDMEVWSGIPASSMPNVSLDVSALIEPSAKLVAFYRRFL